MKGRELAKDGAMAKWGKGKTLLSVIDTTASFIHLGLDACVLNAKKIGLAYGYGAVEASWVVDGLGGQAWAGIRSPIDQFDPKAFRGGGGREMIDVIRAAHAQGGSVPDTMLICSDFMESAPRPSKVGAELRAWLSGIDTIAVMSLEIPGFEEEYAKQWAYEASEVFGRLVEVWRPNAMIALAEAQEMRDWIKKPKRSKVSVKPKSL